jgi:hypothetical protein
LVDFPEKFEDPEGRVYTLKRTVWSHIVAGENPHGELVDNVNELKKCIEEPDEIIPSKQSQKRYIYRRNPRDLDYKFLVVVVDRSENIVVTAYPTNRDSF